MVHLYIKIFLIFSIALAVLHTLRFIYSTTYYLSDQGSLVAFRTGTWTCEMDKRLIVHLRNELREREKLLKYREKVINKLRKDIANLNRAASTVATNVNITGDSLREMAGLDSMKNLSEKLPAENRLHRNVRSPSQQPTPFPEDLDKVAGTNKRPCCVGLKRMTDILRKYMDIANQLKEQVAIYESRNLTAELIKYGEVVKKRTIVKNCSTRFIPATVEKEKDGLFLSSDMKSIYEAIPLYLQPKQKIGNFGAKHRNLALKGAFYWALKELKRKTKQELDLRTAPDVIFKTDSLKGNQYRFSVKTVTGKRYSIPVLRPLGPYLLNGPIIEQSARQEELINIIIPISERPNRLKDFLEMFKTRCIEENVFLTFVTYGNATETRKLKEIITQFSKDTGFTTIDVMQRDAPFSRGQALHDGVQRWNGFENVLLFFCDIDVYFDVDFLRRCRINTQPASMVYYPILFSQYNPKISNKTASDMNITTESGTWRPLGFGMTCMYRLDYLSVGGFNLEIQGWGGEDNDLYSRMVKSPIKIIRAPDPSLYHKWHSKHCSKSLDKIKYNHCLGAKARYEGSQRQLGLLLFKQNTTVN